MATVSLRIRSLLPWLVALGLSMALPSLARADCLPVAGTDPQVIPAAWPEPGRLRISFLGHATFLIETPGGASAVTDYNGTIQPPYAPDIATMNNAHRTHYTDRPDPAIREVLRGWSEGAEPTVHDVQVEDLRVRNVPTNIRDAGGTRTSGNSIFVFEAAGLCVAHLGHLHHTLTEMHLAELGMIDVVLAPVDGSYTIGLDGLLEVIRQINPAVVVPMHYFGTATLGRFLEAAAASGWQVDTRSDPTIELSRVSLPYRVVLVLPGY
ncbi:MBL fold metallo-hydrolase [Marinivivus vitaminiproducens]|uniref:MBL fold metallo-hydrolase n=1 Tax=Marinivivus vitaminiproducens TaxID=3035935 RepID=UPI00279C075F|nr:MBL fold metallo-hydrolase [Geminicoccaceae bacterium SCSIO 64248]